MRIVCATNRDPQSEVAAGRFREDLLARIHLWTFALPALSQRREDIAPNLEEAGYGATQVAVYERETAFYSEVRDAIKNHSGEELDIKPFEADMRHLINTYIQADAANSIGTIDQFSLVELIIETGIHDAIAQKLVKERYMLAEDLPRQHAAAEKDTLSRLHPDPGAPPPRGGDD